MIKKYQNQKAVSDNGHGFTLLEIITVLGIIAIIAVVSVPVYRQIQPNIDLNSTTRQIVSDLREAQQLAVTEQIVYDIVFDTVNDSYEIVNANSGQTFKQIDISSNINITSVNELTDDTVSFNATGAALESGAIILTNTSNSSSTIEIKPSGYVRISN